MCIFIENHAEFSHSIKRFWEKTKLTFLKFQLTEFTFERETSSFPVADNEVDFIQFNIHSN